MWLLLTNKVIVLVLKVILSNLNCIFTGYDVCGCYDVVTHSNSIEESSETKQFLDSMGIVQQIKSPTFKDFVSLEARLKSYEICPQPFVLDPLILSKAGFYYLGKCVILNNLFTITYFNALY